MIHTVTRTYKDTSGGALSLAESISSEVEHNLDKTGIAIGSNTALVLALTRSKLKTVAITCTVACTLYTNAASTGSPQDTIPLTAGQVLVWSLASDGLARCPFSGDVTALFITNAAIAALTLRCLATN